MSLAVRYLPDWFPGTGFKRVARRMARQLEQTVELPYEFVKRQMREGENKTSYLSEAIKDIGLDPQMEFSECLHSPHTPSFLTQRSPQMVRRVNVHSRRRHHCSRAHDLLPRHDAKPRHPKACPSRTRRPHLPHPPPHKFRQRLPALHNRHPQRNPPLAPRRPNVPAPRNNPRGRRKRIPDTQGRGRYGEHMVSAPLSPFLHHPPAVAFT